MHASLPPALSLRRLSTPLLVCGVLVCSALVIAHQHLVAVVVALLLVALTGALRRVQEESGSRARQRSGREMKPASPGYGAAGQIGDRKGLDAKLESERLRDTRSEEPTSLLLIAVDAFEELKQEEGTLAVEVTMLTLASALARMLPRQGDLLARYNDSTLAVVLRGTDLAGSLRVAARLRWAIVRMGIANESTASGFLTSSIGLAVQHDLASGRTSNLLSTAEAALAAAQTLGHDSLDYRVLGADSRIESNACVHIALPALRAWSPERAPVLHSPQSQPVA